MAGSPIKRARKKARELEEKSAQKPATPELAAGQTDATLPDGEPGEDAEVKTGRDEPRHTPPNNLPALPMKPLDGEVLPPEGAEPTRTALKRAMRQKAQQYAEEALEVLAKAMKSPDERIRVNAANDILDRAHGKPTPELEVGDGGLLVSIIRFSEGKQA